MKTENLHNFPMQTLPPNIFYEALKNITEGQGREGGEQEEREEWRMTLTREQILQSYCH